MADAPPSEPTSSETPPKDACNLAMLCHLLGILGFLFPLIIWLVKKDSHPFINEQGKEALNFQITVLIAVIISYILVFVVIGCVLVPAVLIADIVLCIMAAMAASKGEHYRYPFALRLIK